MFGVGEFSKVGMPPNVVGKFSSHILVKWGCLPMLGSRPIP
jgi:hypothetical protein